MIFKFIHCSTDGWSVFFRLLLSDSFLCCRLDKLADHMAHRVSETVAISQLWKQDYVDDTGHAYPKGLKQAA